MKTLITLFSSILSNPAGIEFADSDKIIAKVEDHKIEIILTADTIEGVSITVLVDDHVVYGYNFSKLTADNIKSIRSWFMHIDTAYHVSKNDLRLAAMYWFNRRFTEGIKHGGRDKK